MRKLPNTYQLVIKHGITFLLLLLLLLLKYLFLFVLLHLCVSMGVHVPCEQVPKDARRKHQIPGYEMPMWVLRTKLESSAEAVSVHH